MKHILISMLIAFSAFASSKVLAQSTDEEDNKTNISFNGFVMYEAFYDTYKSADSRDGNLYLYPLRPKLDPNRNDINKTGQLEMVSVQTRLNSTIKGPDTFGAKTFAFVEGDFEGSSQNMIQHLVLRHAFINISKGNANLRLGQFWHPMFVTDNFPAVLAFGAALPIEPFSRAPQARFNYQAGDVNLMFAALVHGYNKTPGEYEAQRNAAFPDIQFQLKYKTGALLAGGTLGYKILKPRLETDLGFKTDETIGSYNLQGFVSYTANAFTIKTQAVYGEDLSCLTMLGGYGIKDDSFDLYGNYSYTNMKTFSAWAEIITNSNNFTYGLFAGYTQNLGFAQELQHLLNQPIIIAQRGADIAGYLRLSPRITYTSGPLIPT